MEIVYLKPAAKDLRQLKDATITKRIAVAVRQVANGEGAPDVVSVVGRPPWRRLRVGDWRILFRTAEIDGTETLIVLRVIPRGELDAAVARLPDVD